MRTRKGTAGSPSPTQPRTYKLTPEQVERRRASLVLANQVRAINRQVATATGPDPELQVRKAQLPAPPKMVTITLLMRHSINGKFYGPGIVTLTESKANAFLNVEHEAQAKEASLFQERAFIVSFRGGVPVRREVPAAMFDTLLAREELPIQSMGGPV